MQASPTFTLHEERVVFIKTCANGVRTNSSESGLSRAESGRAGAHCVRDRPRVDLPAQANFLTCARTATTRTAFPSTTTAMCPHSSYVQQQRPHGMCKKQLLIERFQAQRPHGKATKHDSGLGLGLGFRVGVVAAVSRSRKPPPPSGKNTFQSRDKTLPQGNSIFMGAHSI